MYAIVDIAGQQFKVEAKKKLFVHRLEAEEGSSVEISKVMLIEDNGEVLLGKPYISGASVVLKVLEHLKGDKVLVFKKKRRKGYQKLNGHRQFMTRVEVESIHKTAATSAKSKKKTAKTETPVAEDQTELQESKTE